MQRETYEHSGGLGSAALLTPVAGLLAGLLGAFLYAYASVYSPIVGFVSLLAVFLFSYGVGWAIAQTGRLGHCRNPTFLHGVGAVIGLATLYFSWVAFEWVLIGREDPLGLEGLLGLMASPATVWGIAQDLSAVGWYSVGSSGSAVSGIPLWLTWIAEAGIIVGVVLLTAGSRVSEDVYCEHTKTWVPRWETPVPLRVLAEPETLERAITSAGIEDLEALEAATTEELPRLSVEVWETQEDPGTSAYQLRLLEPKVEKDGEVKVEEKELGPKYAASAEVLERLRALAAREPTELPAAEGEDEAATPEA
ncbi:MAG: hypothetical protein AAF725_09690 [Acidobacteriota bacterium]